MMRSLSTSALGQPSETKLTEGAADFVMFLDRTVLSYSPLQSRSRRDQQPRAARHLQHCSNHRFSCRLGRASWRNPMAVRTMRLVLAIATSSLALLAQPPFAQTYPSKPIHILV